MKNIILIMLAVGIGMGTQGCVSAGGYSTVQQGQKLTKIEEEIVIRVRREDSEKKLKDVYNGYKIISEDNDLYIEKIDGTEKRRLTNTPNVKETWGFISKDGQCVSYKTTDSTYLKEEIFVLPINKDDSLREKIDDNQWENLHSERFPEAWNF